MLSLELSAVFLKDNSNWREVAAAHFFEVALLVDVYQVSGVFGRECMVEVSWLLNLS